MHSPFPYHVKDMKKLSYIMGIDGGGSKTRALLYNCTDMKPENFIEADSSTNHHVIGFTNASNVLREIIDSLMEDERNTFIIVGLAGLDSKYDREIWSRYLNRTYKRSLLLHDVHISLFAASYGEPGIIVISGTGFNVYGWDGVSEWYAGNWGWKVGDDPSGYRIGRDALNYILRYLDGRVEECIFYNDIMSYLRLASRDDLIAWIYNARPGQIADLSKMICKHYQHDPVAKRIIDRAVEEAVLSVKAVISKLDGDYPVNYTGGMFNCTYYKNLFLKYLKDSGYSIGEYVKYPVIGAILYGLKKSDMNADLKSVKIDIRRYLEHI